MLAVWAGGRIKKKLFAKLTLAAAMTLAAAKRPAPFSHIAVAAELMLVGTYAKAP